MDEEQSECIEMAREQEEMAKEILAFRRINASLKKRIQARDKKLKFDYPYLAQC